MSFIPLHVVWWSCLWMCSEDGGAILDFHVNYFRGFSLTHYFSFNTREIPTEASQFSYWNQAPFNLGVTVIILTELQWRQDDRWHVVIQLWADERQTNPGILLYVLSCRNRLPEKHFRQEEPVWRTVRASQGFSWCQIKDKRSWGFVWQFGSSCNICRRTGRGCDLLLYPHGLLLFIHHTDDEDLFLQKYNRCFVWQCERRSRLLYSWHAIQPQV